MNRCTVHMKKIKPKPGQESVWDYPRPPRVAACSDDVRVLVAGQEIANSQRTYRVLETSHPPVYYLPPEDINMELLERAAGKRSFCEWKGSAAYWNFKGIDQNITSIAWSYPDPSERFLPIKEYLAFYPSKVDEAYVNGERVQAQEGDFYGGWITDKIVGPFKGGAGTWGW